MRRSNGFSSPRGQSPGPMLLDARIDLMNPPYSIAASSPDDPVVVYVDGGADVSVINEAVLRDPKLTKWRGGSAAQPTIPMNCPVRGEFALRQLDLSSSPRTAGTVLLLELDFLVYSASEWKMRGYPEDVILGKDFLAHFAYIADGARFSLMLRAPDAHGVTSLFSDVERAALNATYLT